MNAAETAKLFAALGHEGRLMMFRLVATAGPQGMPAGEIGRRTGQLQNTTSSNLAVLTNAGLLKARREGRSIFYVMKPEVIGGALDFLTENLVTDLNPAGATASGRPA